MATWETPRFNDTSATSAKSIQQFGDEFFRYLVENLVTYAGWTALVSYIGNNGNPITITSYVDADHNPFINTQRSSTVGQPRSWILLKSPDTLVSYYQAGELKTKPVYMLIEANANDASLRPKTKILFSYHLPDINYPSPQDYSDDLLSSSETPAWKLNSYWGFDPDETNLTFHTYCSKTNNEKATFRGLLANAVNFTTNSAVVFNYANNGAFWCVFTNSYTVLSSNSKFPAPSPKYALFVMPIENPSAFDLSPLVTFSGYVGEEGNGIPNHAMAIRNYFATNTTTKPNTDFFGYASNLLDRPSAGSALRGLDADGVTPSQFAIPCPFFYEFTSTSTVATINEYSPINNTYMSGTSPNYPDALDGNFVSIPGSEPNVTIDSHAFPALIVSGKRGTISYRGTIQDTYLCKAQLTTNNAADSGSYLVSAAAYYGGTLMEISEAAQNNISYSNFKNANGLPLNPLGGSVEMPYYIGNILLPAT